MRLFGYISAVLLVAVSTSHAAERYVCPNGKVISSFDDCPTVKNWGAFPVTKTQHVRISGLSDETVMGRFREDDSMTQISLSLKDTGSHFTKIGIIQLSHEKRQPYLQILGPSLSSDEEKVRGYNATTDSYGLYQIHKSDGTRLAFEECLINAIAQEARTNPDSDIEFESSCKKSD